MTPWKKIIKISSATYFSKSLLFSSNYQISLNWDQKLIKLFKKVSFTSISTKMAKYHWQWTVFLAEIDQDRFSMQKEEEINRTLFLWFWPSKAKSDKTFKLYDISTFCSSPWERNLKFLKFWTFPFWLSGSDSPT